MNLPTQPLHLARHFAVAITLTLFTSAAHAQTPPAYPTRVVRVIVTYAPGGGSDLLARLIGTKVAEDTGQQWAVDNRPGGNATIGTQAIARATPDGYTVGVIDAALTINPGLYAKLPYDATKDFSAVTMIASSPLLLLAHPSVPAKTAKELIALAKAQPGQLTFSSSGNGSAMHLSLELFRGAAGVNVIHVPYKGGGPSMAAIVSGEVAMSFNTPAATATYIKAGRVRGLAITGAKRYAALPDIPTLTEAGINGVEADPFWGVVMPTGTPQTIISRLHELWTKPVNAPDTRARLLDMGFVPVANTPAEFAAQIRNDTAKWIRVIKAAGIQPQ